MGRRIVRQRIFRPAGVYRWTRAQSTGAVLWEERTRLRSQRQGRGAEGLDAGIGRAFAWLRKRHRAKLESPFRCKTCERKRERREQATRPAPVCLGACIRYGERQDTRTFRCSLP